MADYKLPGNEQWEIVYNGNKIIHPVQTNLYKQLSASTMKQYFIEHDLLTARDFELIDWNNQR